jgi:hypothetical protein
MTPEEMQREIDRQREVIRKVNARCDYIGIRLGEVIREREQMAEALTLIAAPMRPDGSWNRDRGACRQLALGVLARLNVRADRTT